MHPALNHQIVQLRIDDLHREGSARALRAKARRPTEAPDARRRTVPPVAQPSIARRVVTRFAL